MTATKKTEQDVLQSTFQLWRNYTQAYADFAMETMEQTVKQGLNAWEQLDHLMSDSFKKVQELSEREQEMLLEVTEKFAEQLRTASERVSKLYSDSE